MICTVLVPGVAWPKASAYKRTHTSREGTSASRVTAYVKRHPDCTSEQVADGTDGSINVVRYELCKLITAGKVSKVRMGVTCYYRWIK